MTAIKRAGKTGKAENTRTLCKSANTKNTLKFSKRQFASVPNNGCKQHVVCHARLFVRERHQEHHATISVYQWTWRHSDFWFFRKKWESMSTEWPMPWTRQPIQSLTDVKFLHIKCLRGMLRKHLRYYSECTAVEVQISAAKSRHGAQQNTGH